MSYYFGTLCIKGLIDTRLPEYLYFFSDMNNFLSNNKKCHEVMNLTLSVQVGSLLSDTRSKEKTQSGEYQD